MPASRRDRTSSGAHRAAHRAAGQLGQLRVVQAVHRRGPARTARAAGSRTAAGRRPPAPPGRRPSRRRAQRHVGGGRRRRRAARWRTGRPRGSRRRRPAGPAGPGPRPTRTPWPIRPGAEGVEAGGARCPARPARRRAASRAARPGRRSGRPGRSPRSRPRRSSLDSPKPTTPRPAYCAASRASVRASSGCRVRFAAMTTPTPTPVARVAVAGGVEDQLDGRGQPAEPRRVRRGVDLDLQPAGALGALVLGRLAHQPAHVGLAPRTTERATS